MDKSDRIKDSIISSTIKLIEESDGNIEAITSREIAKKANISLGLINYHFQSKENLIEICVQKIIGNVILSFQPEGGSQLEGIAYLIYVAQQVFHFLFENGAVSRISILGDFKSPEIDDNTMKSMKGFMSSLEESHIPEKDRALFAFTLTEAMQGAFLRKDESKEIFGYDLKIKRERDSFIEDLIMKLNEGFRHE